MNVGERVSTRFCGRTTFHVITERREMRNCQGGIAVRVEPEVPGSRDDDNPWNEGWISLCWFEPAPEQEELFA